MKRFRYIAMILLLAIIPLVSNVVLADVSLEPLIIDGMTVTHYGTNDAVMIPTTYTEKETEFRGVWVATVYNLNMPQHTSETQYKAAYQDLLDEVEESNMNAIVFQVRPTNDAFYDSQYAPWSRWLTGTEGNDPGWDVMAYMISEAHARGIEFHAWLNPYRVANSTLTQASYLQTLHAENFAKQRPDLVVTGIQDSHDRYPHILNPGEPEVKTYIRNVVTELMTLYDVDGIHFDDYFYPYSGISSDTTTYDTYKETGQAIADWRRQNVDDVVQGVYQDIEAYNTANNENVRFGISPFGIWKNGGSPDGANVSSGTMESYFDQYADTRKWVEEGWLHYINPQIYWNFEQSVAPYADVVDWWASVVRGTGVDLIIGHAPSSADSQNWDTDELANQLRYNQKHPEIIGEMMYSAAYLDYSHMQYVETNNWTTTPLNILATSDVPIPTITITGTDEGTHYSSDVTIEVTGSGTLSYKLDDGPWMPYTTSITLTEEGEYAFYAKSTDALGEDSLITGDTILIDKQNDDIPVISISGTPIGENYVVGADLVITNATSNQIWVKINQGSEGTWQEYTGPISLDDASGYYISAKTINAEGIESELATLLVYTQEECYDDPVITITGTGNDPYFQTATMTLSSTAPNVLYKINDGTFDTYTGPVVFDTEGTYTITYKNDDACGTEFTKDITIDQTAPVVPTITITGDYDGERYYTSETTISLSHEETGVDVFYRLHNGSAWTAWDAFTESFDLIYNATYTVEFYAVDQAGNESDLDDARIRLDIPPREDNLYVIRDGEIVTYYGTDTAIELPTSYTEPTEQIRAIWIATVGNIDIDYYTNEDAFKAEIIRMFDIIEANHFNVMFFQVRPMNDAYYESDYAPWSRFLMGTEGTGPGWDILPFIIEQAHQRGIEFHAWLNPYRVSTGSDSKSAQLALLDDTNFAKMNPDLVIQDNSGRLILNPGEPQVRAYITNVIQELMSKYDIDGIHFDDYFYSYNGTPTSEDASAFAQYGDGMTLDDWRRNNIDIIVEDIYNIVQTYNTNHSDHVKFGISPFGVWKNGGSEDGAPISSGTMQSYYAQYADTKKWVEEGWLDYILPQLYWEFDHSVAPFAPLVDWWVQTTEGTGVDLIIGHGFYRYDDDTWEDRNELLEQLRYISQYDVIIGSSFFTYNTLESFDTEVVEALERLNTYYWTDYVTFPWDSDVEPYEPLVCDDGYHEEDGECVENPLVCDDGYHEEDGECIEDVVTCEEGYELVDDECQLIVEPEPEPEPEPETGCFGSITQTSIFLITMVGVFAVGFLVARKRSWI